MFVLYFLLGFLAGAISIYIYLTNSHKKEEEILKIEKAKLEKEVEFLRSQENLLQEKFKSVAFDVLKKSNENFLELAKSSYETWEKGTEGILNEKTLKIEHKIKELEESLKRFDEFVKNVEKERIKAYSKLAMGQENLDKNTKELIDILKNPKGRGNWGEIQLIRIVELAGMKEHCDYQKQVRIEKDGEVYYPDLVIYLPQDKKIIVDSKAPLQAFLNSLSSTEKNKDKLEDEFIKNTLSRIKELSKKEYYEKLDGAIEFTILFLPSEAMFSLLIEKNPSIVEEALAQNVMLTSPLTLIAFLKSVAFIWKQYYIQNEAKKILEKCLEIYEALCNSTEEIDSLGKAIKKVIDSYNNFVNHLEKKVLIKGKELSKLNEKKHLIELNELSESVREPKKLDSGVKNV